jgi:DNA-binding NarL/FixJ family response regulator
MSNKEIARHANLFEGAVKMYLHHILTKLRLTNQTQLATYVRTRTQGQNGLLLGTGAFEL